MSGKGKGGKMMGKGLKGEYGLRHHAPKNSILGITNPGIKRLARRAGVKRISGTYPEALRGELKKYLDNLVGDAVIYSTHARRKTVTIRDVVLSSKRQAKALYGGGV
ncbi:MAG: histone H4 [Promethearchaeota archaeon]